MCRDLGGSGGCFRISIEDVGDVGETEEPGKPVLIEMDEELRQRRSWIERRHSRSQVDPLIPQRLQHPAGNPQFEGIDVEVDPLVTPQNVNRLQVAPLDQPGKPTSQWMAGLQ